MARTVAVVVAAVALFLAASCGSVRSQEVVDPADGLNLRPERVPPAQFRIRCTYSHTNNDDPVLKPNQIGTTHMHDYFGARGVNGRSIDPTQFVGKATTCSLRADAAAYIFPALFMRTNRKNANGRYIYQHLIPTWTLFYYRTAVSDPSKIRTIPPGLTMLTGDPKAGLTHVSGANVEWWCGVYGKHFSNFPDMACAENVALIGKLNYPSCWNGRDLRSPDGKAHMKHIALNTSCPASHPIAIPRISIKVYYKVTAGMRLSWPSGGRNADPPLYLSTADTGGSGSGHEYHSDFMNGWEPRTLQDLITRCINQNRKCLVANETVPNPFVDGPHCGTPTKPKACT